MERHDVLDQDLVRPQRRLDRRQRDRLRTPDESGVLAVHGLDRGQGLLAGGCGVVVDGPYRTDQAHLAPHRVRVGVLREGQHRSRPGRFAGVTAVPAEAPRHRVEQDPCPG